MAEAGLQSVEELTQNLAQYREQLQQVEQLLLLDPDNEELQEMHNSLQEVIDLTADLVKDAQQQPGGGASSSAAAPSSGAAADGAAGASTSAAGGGGDDEGATAGAAAMLPASVAEQIKAAQARAALQGQAPSSWAVGARCLAQYAADQQYYPAVVESVTAAGNFVVLFDGYGNSEEVAPSGVLPPPEATEVYTGVAAPKRKKVEEQPVVSEIPKWLTIKPEDDEKTVLRKKKLMKSYKSKIRFQQMDLAQRDKAQSWQRFQQGKGVKKKTGFFTGRKKESMFKVPEGTNSKVGVIGSGKGMTAAPKAGRHEFSVE